MTRHPLLSRGPGRHRAVGPVVRRRAVDVFVTIVLAMIIKFTCGRDWNFAFLSASVLVLLVEMQLTMRGGFFKDPPGVRNWWDWR